MCLLTTSCPCVTSLPAVDGDMQHSVNFHSSLFNQGPNSPKHHGNPPHCVSTPHPSVSLLQAQRLCITIALIFFVNSRVASALFLPLQQIRKLRRELDASQEKVATLTSQLAANVSLFASKQLARFHGNLPSESIEGELWKERESFRRSIIPGGV